MMASQSQDSKNCTMYCYNGSTHANVTDELMFIKKTFEKVILQQEQDKF